MSTSSTNKTLRPLETEVERVPTNGTVPISPRSWQHVTQLETNKHHASSVDIDNYFVGPRDMSKHSKWPIFMRMHGSVLPKMIMPLTVVTIWSTAITLLSHYVYELKVNSLLLTVLGFVVSMAISFRTSSAYERYTEGRKYWAQMLLVSQNMARTIWIHAAEREGDLGREDLLAKRTALNLIVAFSRAMQHKLRFEPGIDYDDLRPLVEYLDTFAKAADTDIPHLKESGKIKAFGEYLGVSFAESNPRKRMKRSKKPLGNLPLEILNHISAYTESIITNETLKIALYQNQIIGGVVSLNEVMVGLERILNTPLPLAYSIAISQITWVYVMMLPFQLWASLQWITIPGCIFSSYIILGMNAIGREIENPFGNDVNDLPLEAFCEELASDIDIITSLPVQRPADYMRRVRNMPLYPLSEKGFESWSCRGKHEIREALMTKTKADMRGRRSFNPERANSMEEEKHHHGALQQTEA